MIIAGGSARAAAASALRAGFAPWCVDLFADADLARACPVRRIRGSDYPRDLPAMLAQGPPGSWMYTGAIENHPHVVERVARPLLGNPATVLRRVRDPWLLHAVLSRHGVRCPEIARGTPDERRPWLVKPIRSAGGARIRVWSPETPWDARPCYVQERIDGDSYAAAYVGRTGGAELVGITRQLIGEAWLHAAPFHYCGSVGPVQLSASASATLERIGNALVADFGLRGLFGVDFILNGGEPRPVEVNPRYTASMEIIERATGRVLLVEHLHAFSSILACRAPTLALVVGRDDSSKVAHLPSHRVHGKAIVFAPQILALPPQGPWDSAQNTLLSDATVAFADLPGTGVAIEPGAPVLTAFAGADNLVECIAELRRIAAELYGLFGAPSKR